MFQRFRYSARLPENAPQGTTVVFREPYSTLVRDDDSGKDGVFSLSLENNNGTFEVLPTVGEQKANFVIRVRNNELLDFEERAYVVFAVGSHFCPYIIFYSNSIIQMKKCVNPYFHVKKSV